MDLGPPESICLTLIWEIYENIGILKSTFCFQGKVVVIRGEGPKGGPGMPEMLTPTSAIMGAGLGKVCYALTLLLILVFRFPQFLVLWCPCKQGYYFQYYFYFIYSNFSLIWADYFNNFSCQISDLQIHLDNAGSCTINWW